MSDATGIPSPVSEPKRRNALANFFIRLVKEKPLGTASGIIMLILILVAIFADVLAPYPSWKMHLADRLAGPSSQYLLGTDELGRDLLSRLLLGARISLVVGLAATTLNVMVATLIGGTSGFLGGKLDLAVQRFVDAWMCLPGLLILLTIMSIVGRGITQILGYPFNRSPSCKLGRWITRAPACTIQDRWASSRHGSRAMRTAWTTWSGCGGPPASAARRVVTMGRGGSVTVGSCAPGARAVPR